MKKSATSQTNSSPKRPVSERKAAANRANAQHSTGPRTPEGKAHSSLNSLRHGILARAAFNPAIDGEERRAEFEALVDGLAQEYQPRTMTEHMTVQQLAGCYWRLAKVWTYEMEAAWRARAVHNMGITEHEQLERFNFGYATEKIIKHQHEVFADAGLGEVNLPLPASVNTILRYQGSINTMISRCLALLERRRKQRTKSEEAFAEPECANEPTEAAQEAKASREKPSASAKDGALHKRTQKDPTNPALDANQDANSAAEDHAPGVPAASDPPRSA
jgi:hypothetical protein